MIEERIFTISISKAPSLTSTNWIKEELTWSQLLLRFSNSKQTGETIKEYSELCRTNKNKATRIKDVGGFVGGALDSTRRTKKTVVARSLITIDIDNPSENIIPQLKENVKGYTWAIYSTHKHTKESPRYRLVVPLKEDVPAQEYPVIAEKASRLLGANFMDMLDPSTFQAERLMFWPSHPKDATPVFESNEGALYDAKADVLNKAANEGNSADVELRVDISTGEVKESDIRSKIESIADPLKKPGIIGAFCRAYCPIDKAIMLFLDEVYIYSGINRRYNLIGADSTGGLVIYGEGRFAYSNHSNKDPACDGHLHNAFDLVRIHLFGNDEKAFKKMLEFAGKDKKTKKLMLEEEMSEFIPEPEPELPPFLVRTKRGIVINPNLLASYFKEGNIYFITRSGNGVKDISFWVYDKIYLLSSHHDIRNILSKYVEDETPGIVRTSAIDDAFKQTIYNAPVCDLNDFDSDENVVVFKNGIYHLDTGELTPHTPDYLGTIMLPTIWKPKEAEAMVFEKYLDDLTAGDEEKKLLLKEYMGVVLTNIPGYMYKKSLFLVGRGNSGKTQLLNLITMLVGEHNTANVDLQILEKRFGTSYIFMKRLVCSGDMSFAALPELKIFKQLVGGDTVFMEHKGAQGFFWMFRGLLWFNMNDTPSFGGDHGKHVFDRILLVKAPNSVPKEKQDKKLLSKMYRERNMIIPECLALAAKTVKRGYKFTIPKAMKTDLYEFEMDTSSVKRCAALNFERTGKLTKGMILYRFYLDFCVDNGIKNTCSQKQFVRELADFYGVLTEELIVHKRDGNYLDVANTAESKANMWQEVDEKEW
ncbi:MAG: hypothetical protein LBB34_01850 [Holosporales bacterium]|jgi:P4 family phage/plasmid primase-like protien|nr:hypothetical protein [Holosporales bacterium]